MWDGFNGGWEPLRALIMYRAYSELVDEMRKDKARKLARKKEGKL